MRWFEKCVIQNALNVSMGKRMKERFVFIGYAPSRAYNTCIYLGDSKYFIKVFISILMLIQDTRNVTFSYSLVKMFFDFINSC